MALYEVEVTIKQTVSARGTVWVEAASEEAALRLADVEYDAGRVSLDDELDDCEPARFAVLSVDDDADAPQTPAMVEG